MTRFLQSKTNQTLPIVATGEGITLIDTEGRRYLDACSGVVVSNLGHNHPRVIAAIQRQAGRLSYAHAGTFRTAVAEELADFLVERLPGLSHAYFLSSGSEIMEIALKTAYQYFVERGQPERTLFVSRRQNYHGCTLGVLAITGNPQRRGPFPPIMRPGTYVSPCYAYRDQRADETARAYGERLARELDDTIRALGAERVAGFVAETVVGSTSGAVPPVEGYLEAIRKVCDRHGVLLILDEVMCGLGRTGHLLAAREDGVTPDILTIGKGLAAGYVPISGMLVSQAIHDTFATGSGQLNNGQTFVSHTLGCAAALEVQKTIEDDGLLENVRARGDQLRGLLHETLGDHPNVGDIRGRGLFVGLELVADRASKAPLPVGQPSHRDLKARALELGLMVYPKDGTIDGVHGMHVMLCPPFIVTAREIEQIVGLFEQAFTAVFPRG